MDSIYLTKMHFNINKGLYCRKNHKEYFVNSLDENYRNNNTQIDIKKRIKFI